MRTWITTLTMRRVGGCAVVAVAAVLAVAVGSVATVPRTVASAEDLASSIGNRVWWDLDDDGVQDASEPGIAGVRVDVTNLGADDALGGGDDDVRSAMTDADGNYVVEDLPNGHYRVFVEGAALPAGFVPTYDLDGGVISPDALWTGALTDGSARRDIDFGYDGSGSIGDTIWFDQDADGTRDAGEPGLGDVTVTATWLGVDGIAGGADDRSFVTTTNADGRYLFDDLPAGNHIVVVTPDSLPVGFSRQTTDPDGNLDGTTTVALSAGGTNLTQDFGYSGTSSIGDTVWFDRDGFGSRGVADEGIPGAVVSLAWAGPDGVAGGGDDATFTTTTGSSGRYLFDNLPAGDYLLDVGGLPPDYVNTFDEDLDVDSRVTVALLAAQRHLTADFGYRGATAVGDRVWWDIDADGVQDADEPGLGGVEVTVTDTGPDLVPGDADDITFLRTTDADGRYLVSNTPQGEYTVHVTGGVPAGLGATYDEDSGTSSPDQTVHVSLGAAAHNTADFGYVGSGSIGDVVYLDVDGDGTYGTGDAGLSGAAVTLRWAGRDAVFDTPDDITLDTLTDATGSYSFDGLPAGAFRVTVDGTGLPAGLVATADPDGGSDSTSQLHLVSGHTDATQDFGYRGTGSVGDMLWLDLDGNGAFDHGEPGLAMVDIAVTWAGMDGRFGTADDVVAGAVTDRHGHYLVEHLPAGAYRVAIDAADVPGGVLPTTDPNGGADNGSALNLAAGVARLEQDFGYRGDATVGDRVWIDVDADGLQDPTEPGYAGLTVSVLVAGLDRVFGSADDISIQTVTVANGAFESTGLPEGDVRVSYAPRALSAGYLPGSDADGAEPTTTWSNLTNGQTVDDVDFGVRGTATLSDVVWNDVDGDGVQDAGEMGVAGVVVEAVWNGPLGRVVLRSVTGPDGSWSLTALPPGAYSVSTPQADTRAGLVPTGLVPATRDGVASVVPPGGFATARLSQVASASIGDLVWLDTDRDGVRDPTEGGLGSITVTLLDEQGRTIATTPTDSAGRYVFTGLPPEIYRVVIDLGTVPAGHRQFHDPDGIVDAMSSVDVRPGSAIMAEDFSFGPMQAPPFAGARPWRNVALGLSLMSLASLMLIALRRRPIARRR